ncbi:MAG TPA: LLM class F420-dependent oxidoreductase [Candidatus Dormibacteraeota bacterium]|nr:LLM class F420-dependent oxidoreductase [Candidatus Dormibacteraeota bacterium]
MKLLGFQIPNYTFPGVTNDKLFDHVAMLASTAEKAGFDSVYVMDHFYQLPNIGPRTEPMLEAYTVLSGIAARTKKIRIGALVTGVTYRNPALLAKTVTTLDVVSSGRAILGLGAAWNEDEHRGYGYDFPPVGERISRLEEALQICRAMFREEVATFRGQYYRINGALNFPRPVQANGPPIMVGGGGEQRTLKLVAQYADMCNIFGDAATVRHKIDVLERHCETVGRDPRTIIKTRLGTLLIRKTDAEAERVFQQVLNRPGINQEYVRSVLMVGGPDRVAEQAQQLLDAGLDGLIFNMPHIEDPEAIELAGKTLAGLRQAAAAR